MSFDSCFENGRSTGKRYMYSFAQLCDMRHQFTANDLSNNKPTIDYIWIFQVILADNNILRGPQLLPHLSGFPCLRELDLSAVGRSSLSSSSSTPFILDDKCIIGFFHALHTHFRYALTFQLFNLSQFSL